MKKWSFGLVMFILLTGNYFAEDNSKIKKDLTDLLFDIKDVKVKLVNSKEFDKVFEAKIYEISSSVKDKYINGSTFIKSFERSIRFKKDEIKFESMRVRARFGGRLQDKEIPLLEKVLNKKFKMKTRSDALVFDKALRQLYPRMLNEFNRKITHGKELVFKKGEKWYFIHDTFINNIEGFVVTVTASGTIKNIRYSYYFKDIPEYGEGESVNVDEDVKKEMLKRFYSNYELVMVKNDSKSLNQVFKANFYKVKKKGSVLSVVVMKDGKNIKILKNPWGAVSKKRLLDMEKLLNVSFKLKTKEDALIVADALKELNFTFQYRGSGPAKIQQDTNGWSVILRWPQKTSPKERIEYTLLEGDLDGDQTTHRRADSGDFKRGRNRHHNIRNLSQI